METIYEAMDVDGASKLHYGEQAGYPTNSLISTFIPMETPKEVVVQLGIKFIVGRIICL